jgi:hypothetical protein
MTKHFLLIGISSVALLYGILIITGVAPIAPRSHEIIHEAVAENPTLNTLYYRHLSNEIYISINESDRLFDQWLTMTKLGSR